MSAAPAAMALFMGPALILSAVNEEFREADSVQPQFGVPLVEAYPDPLWRQLQALMFEVYATRTPRFLEWAVGRLWVIPYESEDGRRGVVTHYRRCAPSEVPLPTAVLAELARSAA